MLKIEQLSISYGAGVAVQSASLKVGAGETVALIGANGAGKSSILKGVMGLAASTGSVSVKGQRLDGLRTHQRVAKGVALSPEGRHVFPRMTVMENLELGLAGSDIGSDLFEDMFTLFPRLRERRSQLAGSMSGGEQQMLAIARALMSRPSVLMLDEPTLGLAPIVVDQIVEMLDVLRKRGMGILLAEQNAEVALSAADRGYVLETGTITREGRADQLASDEAIRKSYLGM